jgi:ribosome-interacting GTPase 1
MPANLSPEFKNAQAAFRSAREPRERLDCLREMLRTIPKHKGTEHLQADIKTRIKELTEELAGPRKGGARGGPALVIRPEGAAQVALIGPPNVGKSSLHARLTGSHTAVGPYPFATKFPVPGMLPYHDVHIQLVDLPPISADFMEPWFGNAVQHADGALLALDLGEPDCVEQLEAIRQRLEEKSVTLLESFEATAPDVESGVSEDAALDPFRVRLPTLLVANKSDLLDDPATELATFTELTGARYPAISVSAETGAGLERIGALLFDGLGVVRVYSKVPGHPPEMEQPFTVRRESTVRDVARLVHRGRSSELKFARVWGTSAEFDGQQVSGDHPVRDGDVVELHW